MMAEMGMTMDMPWSTADVLFTFAMWAVMMVGMMMPSAAPVMLLFAAMHWDTRRTTPIARGVCLRCRLPARLDRVQRGRRARAMGAASGGDAVAGDDHVQRTTGRRHPDCRGCLSTHAVQGACLTHCRSPLGFLMSHWRDGTSGALRMGIEHGTFCVGCCWALMGVLFVVGVMNLPVWVAAMIDLRARQRRWTGGRARWSREPQAPT